MVRIFIFERQTHKIFPLLFDSTNVPMAGRWKESEAISTQLAITETAGQKHLDDNNLVTLELELAKIGISVQRQ